ncbi:MAG: InlB B-repeat-containing protein [Acetatifactor muris]|nr:InlB B-repeat-containing protein [Acetatifactor muris]
MSGSNGPFGSVALSEISFGERVETIPRCLLTYAKFSVESLDLPGTVTSIGNLAFYALWSNDITIGSLTIGENIGYIGKAAFSNCSIGSLYYRAGSAKVPAPEKMGDCPFYGSGIGNLEIAEGVTELPAYVMGGIELAQDELVIPDSVTKIGRGAFCDKMLGSDIEIQTLVIGKNVSYIGAKAFADTTIQRAVVYALKADEEYKALSFINTELPICGYAEIHTGSDFYNYFTKRTSKANIISMCREFETAYGEEYFDADKGVFVTPYTESCTVCGYATQGEDTEDAHTVKFVDYDGRVLSRQNIKNGASTEAPENPSRTGYRFTGWNRGFENITEDVTVTAQYEIRKFTVTFKDGETVLSRQEVEYKKSAQASENPSRPAEEWGTWEFAGWEGNYASVTEDMTVQAKFTQKWNEYEVIFYDAAGNVLSVQAVEYGKSAEAPENPEKKADAWNTYIFAGWSGDYTSIHGDMTLRPQYEAEARSYTVTFVDGSTIIDRQTVKAGGTAELPKEPEREAEEWGMWEFAGWKGNYRNVLKDETVEAVFEKEWNVYTVIFEDADGNTISEQEVTHGHGAVLPKAPEKEQDEEYAYIFTGWDGDTEHITEDMVFSPVYEEQTRYYTVTFVSDGKTVDTQSVRYGGAASAPENPVKEADGEYSYTFKCWDGDYSFITEDTVFYAVFGKTELPPDDPGDEEPGDKGDEPDDKDEEPGDKDDEPDDKDKEPGDKDKIPDDKDKEPGDKDKTPDDKDKDPGNGDKTPDNSDKTPDDNGGNPGSGDKEPDNGGNPGTETVPESGTEDKRPQKTEEKAGPDNGIKEPEQTEKMETEETAQMEEPKQEEEPDGGGKSITDALLFFLFSCIAFLLFLLFLFLCYGRKKICGTVRRADGTPAAEQRVTLERIDGQEWEDALNENAAETASTDKDGYFCFAGLAKGIYRIALPAMQGRGAFTVTVCMTEDGEDIFTVPESVCGVETEKKAGSM